MSEKVCHLCGQVYEPYGVDRPKVPGKDEFEITGGDVDTLCFAKMADSGQVIQVRRVYNVCPSCMDFIYMVLGFGDTEKKK